MKNLLFFDLNGIIGQPVLNTKTGLFSGYADSHALIENMDYYGVDYALVSHSRSYKGELSAGNSALVQEVKNSERLFPCWHILPAHTGEMPPDEKIKKQLRENNVRAVRISMEDYSISLQSTADDKLFRMFEESNIPVILKHPNLGNPIHGNDSYYMDIIHNLCRQYPKLNIISSGRLRGFYPLLEKFKNLFISLEWEPHPNMIEDIYKRFGAKRILFGTPYCEIAKEISGMPMAMITYADISDESKALIAGENLMNLLGVNLKPVPDLPGKEKFKSILNGEKLDYNVYDIHFHLGPFVPEYKPATGLKETLRFMEKIGVEKVCMNSTEAVMGGDHYKANEEISAICKKYPDKFIGFAVVNPHFSGCRNYIEKCIKEMGFRGIKIHPRIHGCAITDKKYVPVWESSEKYGIPILCHTGEGQAFSEPSQFNEIAPRYQEGTFVIGHTGETFDGIKQCIALANKYKNLYLDISGWGFLNKGYLEFLVNSVNAEKILFGSDFSWLDFKYVLAAVLFADIGEKVKRMILSENARKLLGKIKIQKKKF